MMKRLRTGYVVLLHRKEMHGPEFSEPKARRIIFLNQDLLHLRGFKYKERSGDCRRRVIVIRRVCATSDMGG
jgi:hypothetical protein